MTEAFKVAGRQEADAERQKAVEAEEVKKAISQSYARAAKRDEEED